MIRIRFGSKKIHKSTVSCHNVDTKILKFIIYSHFLFNFFDSRWHVCIRLAYATLKTELARKGSAILSSAKGLDSGRRGHRVEHRNKPIRSSGCKRSGDAGTSRNASLSLIGRLKAHLGGSVDPNRDLWLNRV